MIIPGMSFEDLMYECDKDSQKIQDIMLREVVKIRKPKLLRGKGEVTLKTVTYKSPVTFNRYFIQPKAIYDPTQKSRLGAACNVYVKTTDKNGGVLFLKVPIYHREKYYRYFQAGMGKEEMIEELRKDASLVSIIFTPHFLRRYATRFLGETDESKVDLQGTLEKYLARNPKRVTAISPGKWKYDSEDRMGYETRVSDGVELGMIIEDWVFQANTYISDEMLYEDQDYLGPDGLLWESYKDV